MPSRHSSLAPKTHAAPELRRSLRVLLRSTGSRLTLKPKRDALTRVRHDLRSLVHSVVGYSDLLAEPRYGALSSEQTRFVTHIRTAAEHLQELVDTCIELSRPVSPAEVRSGELQAAPLAQACSRFRATLIERGLACDVSIPTELAAIPLSVDIVALERALTGLALVITRDGSVSGGIAAELHSGRVVLTFRASDAAESPEPQCSLDQLEDQVGNRDFVRLKLSEVLLSRQNATLRVATALDGATIELPR